MTWFFQTNEGVFRQRLKHRRAIAERLMRDMNNLDLAQENHRLITDALKHADDDQRAFAQLFGEPAPLVFRIAQRLEVDVWTYLNNNPRATENNRKALATITKILRLEHEMLTSPLTQRFTQALARINSERPTTGQ